MIRMLFLLNVRLILSAFFFFMIALQNQGRAGAAEPGGKYEADSALKSPQVIIKADEIGKKYLERKFQGIPGIERAANGRLWAVWYGGGEGEGIYNYVMLVTSDDDGDTWSDLKMVIDPDGAGKMRAFDPCLWRDPQGRLWLFWAQSYELFDGRAGVWAMVTENSDDEDPVWSQPRRIGNGVMMNKPVVIKNGEWLLPCAVWDSKSFPELNKEKFANVIVSKDNGLTFSLRGSAYVPERHYDEHMMVELKDGRLWMLVRTSYGMGQSFSSDKGETWTKGEPSGIAHATSRFFIRRLSSGNLLLIKHGPINERTKRKDLTAYISKDDGGSWLGGLLLDERLSVSYPDAVEADGVIYAIYDYSRHKEKEILMAVFTEDDVLAKKGISSKFRKKIIVNKAICSSKNSNGELLYNGIQLPGEWPPGGMDAKSREPMPVPYLKAIPKVIPVDVGRQLFVDDFLIEETTLQRQFHLAQKYKNNPVLKPETELELNRDDDRNAGACPKDGGIWWDPHLECFRMWYEAGWLSHIAYATSTDGLNWERPKLDVYPGTNRILEASVFPDSWTVVPDYAQENPYEHWNMYLRSPGGSTKIRGKCMVSDDGIHWSKPILCGPSGDRSSMFYNPFRKKWVFSLRSSVRGRSSHYWEAEKFPEDCQWQGFDKPDPQAPFFWAGADELDLPDAEIGEQTQLYNIDAVAYESLMLGFYEIHRGPANKECMKWGLPKITELNLAYSRDGFHWDRPDRRAFIAASRTDTWDRGYVQPVGGICLIRGDKLWFYYSGVPGNPDKLINSTPKNGMYYGGSTGVAFLRRDGFVSMDAGESSGGLTTRPLKFSGRHLFVNADVPQGSLRAEVRDVDGNPIAPFTIENSTVFTGDSTLELMKWKGGRDLSALAGKDVRLFFEVTNGSLYAFWISRDSTGRSDGYVAGGGPGYTGLVDTVGKEALEKERRFTPEVLLVK